MLTNTRGTRRRWHTQEITSFEWLVHRRFLALAKSSVRCRLARRGLAGCFALLTIAWGAADCGADTPRRALDATKPQLKKPTTTVTAVLNDMDLTAPSRWLRQQSVQLTTGSIDIRFKGPESAPDCDFNDDGVYDETDYKMLIDAVRAGTHDPNFDLNGDGFVNDTDIAIFIKDSGIFDVERTT